MSKSELQEDFLDEIASQIRSSRSRARDLLNESEICEDDINKIDAIFWEELRSVAHSFLVSLDGGTSLAEKGRVRIVDDKGVLFDDFLHELLFDRLTDEELDS